MNRLRKLLGSNLTATVLCLSVLGGTPTALAQTPVSNAVTYQGQLNFDDIPFNGTVDVRFSLYDDAAAGSQVGSSQTFSNVSIVDGIFTAELDFGSTVFGTDARWLEIEIANPVGGPFTTLTPRQPITGAPYALQTKGIRVDNAGNVAVGLDAPITPFTLLGNGGTFPVGITQNQVGSTATMELTTADSTSAQATRILMRGGSGGDTADIEFYSGPRGGEVQTMIIDGATGNVGVGTSTPTSKLQVAGTVTATSFSGSAAGLTNLPSSNSLDAADGAPTDAVFVNNIGDVGIGTTTPGNVLHVQTPNPEVLVENTNGGAAGVQFINTDRSYSIRMTNAEKFVLRDLTANNTDRLTILPTGEVGIGTSNPETPFSIAANGGVPVGITQGQIGGNAMELTTRDSSGGQPTRVKINATVDAADIEFWSGARGAEAKFGALDYNGQGGRLLLEDQPGTNRVALETTADGGELVIRDAANTVLINLETNGTGGVLNLDAPSTGNTAVLLGTAADGGDLTMREPTTNEDLIRLRTTADGGELELHGDNGNIQVNIETTSDGGLIQARDTAGATQAKIFVNGNGEGEVECDVLQINGGADIAEPFDINGLLTAQPGMVVSIDPHNAGELRLATSAYDRTVAGIISGAGGVKPGMMLKQPGTLADGAHPVALTGRVWCHVDADAGAIQPGDLLTTSNTPGHAMKVTDHGKAQGAIIGKAMTSLASGKGLVLVLVSLQ